MLSKKKFNRLIPILLYGNYNSGGFMVANNKEKKSGNSESITDKIKDSIESFRKSDKVEQLYNSATSNTRDTIAYVLLLAGLILMLLTSTLYGGILVGIVVGAYFGGEIVSFFKHFQANIEKQGMVRSIILLGAILAFFLTAPFIFIGAAIAIGIRQFLVTDNK